MGYTIYNYIFLLCIIILGLYILNKLLKNTEEKTVEPFLSGVQQIYRPYVRKVRIYTTNKYNLIMNKIYVFARKFGLL